MPPTRRPTDPADPVFQTPRLLVRRWRDTDLSALMAVYGDAEAMRWVGDGKPITADACRRWLEVTRANYERRGYGMFAVELRSAPGVIGFCGLVHPGDQGEAEVKYAFLRSSWGDGIATEALVGLIDYAGAVHGLRYLMATVAPENGASRRVLTKAGMRSRATRASDDGAVLVYEYPGHAGES